MQTKYGELPDELFTKYKDKLIGRIFKILPMKEEGCSTWSTYVESLLYELVGIQKMVDELKNNADFLSLIGNLQSILEEEDIKIIRAKVFSCLNLIKKM